MLDSGFPAITGGANGKSVILDAALLLGDDPYHYPDNLPIVGAKGGPGGKPGCGSLPDVRKNWPVRYLVTNTGWGTGIDMRPNPGIGLPGYANYLPVTRGDARAAEHSWAGARRPGTDPVPRGAALRRADVRARRHTPVSGCTAGTSTLAPREPGPPPPGSEPLLVPNPAQNQPTPGPPPPEVGVPSP